MMNTEVLFTIGILILPAIIYFTIRGAVEEGVYNALKRYENDKNNVKED